MASLNETALKLKRFKQKTVRLIRNFIPPIMPKLGVNIDHVATLRQARLEFNPDPITAARICEKGGADSIVAHLREDRRHIQDKDIFALRKIIKIQLNLEMSLTPEIVSLALKVKPDIATLVPERRQELTTEGGLDVARHFARVKKVIQALQKKGIRVSLFIAPDIKQIQKSKEASAQIIEIHTGSYAHAKTKSAFQNEFKKIQESTRYAKSLGLEVSAGHGLDYTNVAALTQMEGMKEFNIGHAIIARSIFVGLFEAVKEMKRLIR